MRNKINIRQLLSTKNIILLSIFIVLAAYVMYPLFHGGFFPTMDDVQVVRVDEMSRELLSGQFPVRMINHLGFGAGSLLFNFYGTLSYYIGALYHLLGISLVRSTKFVFVTGYVLGSLGIFLLVRKYTDKITAYIAVCLFLTSTYLNYDVYTRGSLGEFFGFVLLPLLFWSFLRIEKKNIVSISLAAVMYALSIISHPLTAVMGSVFLVVLIMILPLKKERIISCLYAFLLGLGLAAFSWLPVAFEQKYLNLTHNTYETGQYISNFLTPLQIAGFQKIPWGIRPPLLGMGLFIGAVLGLCLLVLRNTPNKRIILFSGSSFIVSLLMISVISKPLWDASPYVKLVQFPWRYLVITTISAVMLCGSFIYTLKNGLLRLLLGILLQLPAITLQYTYLRPASYNYIAVYTADDMCNTSTWAQEYLPKWVSTCITKKSSIPLVHAKNNAFAVSEIVTTQQGRMHFVSRGKEGVVVIRKYYFPGWIISVDGKSIPTFPYSSYGLLAGKILPGTHTISVAFEDTLDRKIANILSVGTLIFLLGWIGIVLFRNKSGSFTLRSKKR